MKYQYEDKYTNMCLKQTLVPEGSHLCREVPVSRLNQP